MVLAPLQVYLLLNYKLLSLALFPLKLKLHSPCRLFHLNDKSVGDFGHHFYFSPLTFFSKALNACFINKRAQDAVYATTP